MSHVREKKKEDKAKRTYAPTAAQAARAIRLALRDGKPEVADRVVSELVSHLVRAVPDPPREAFDRPPSTGDVRYDTLLAVGLADARTKRHEPTERWMDLIAPLAEEWLWDGADKSSPEFREFIRRQTPPMFLAKCLLLRERDLISP